MQRFLRNPYAVVVLVAAIVLALPLLISSTFHLRVATLTFIFALAVLGLNLLMGFAGQVSLGHAGFFGIGSYAVAIGPTHLGVPSWASLIAGVAEDRKSTRLNSSHANISYAVFCLKK